MLNRLLVAAFLWLAVSGAGHAHLLLSSSTPSLPYPTSVTPSSGSEPDNAVAGAAIATLGCKMSDNSPCPSSAVFGVKSDPNGWTTVNGSKLQSAINQSSVNDNAVDNITLEVTANGVTATSGFALSITPTPPVLSACNSPAVPAPAQAAGYTSLIWCSDFTQGSGGFWQNGVQTAGLNASQINTWLDCKGASNPAWFAADYFAAYGTENCNDYFMLTDSQINKQVVQVQFTAADATACGYPNYAVNNCTTSMITSCDYFNQRPCNIVPGMTAFIEFRFKASPTDVSNVHTNPPGNTMLDAFRNESPWLNALTGVYGSNGPSGKTEWDDLEWVTGGGGDTGHADTGCTFGACDTARSPSILSAIPGGDPSQAFNTIAMLTSIGNDGLQAYGLWVNGANLTYQLATATDNTNGADQLDFFQVLGSYAMPDPNNGNGTTWYELEYVRVWTCPAWSATASGTSACRLPAGLAGPNPSTAWNYTVPQ